MFSALPVELVEHIVSFVDLHDQHTFAAISRVNKLLNAISTPLLYRTIGIRHGKGAYDQQQRSRRVQLLLRTLSRNLPLTQHVEEIVQFIDRHSFSEQPVQVDLDIDVLDHVFERDLDLAPRAFGHLYTSSDEISDETCLLSLLAICPKAQSLILLGDLRYLSLWQHLSLVIDDIRSAEEDGTPIDKTSFFTLRHVRLVYNGVQPDVADDEQQLDIDGLQPLLRFPQIQSLCLDHFEGRSSVALEQTPLGFQSRLERLEIETCYAKGEEIRNLLDVCSKLKSLKIRWPVRQNNFRRFDWADLGNAIRENCPDLEHLHFDHPQGFTIHDERFRNLLGVLNEEYLQNSHLPGLGSMRSLQHLQSLHVSDVALFGAHRDDSFVPADFSDSDDEDEAKHCLESVLPASLKHLIVYCEHRNFRREDIAILSEPGAERLAQLTIMDNHKDEWIARKHEHLTASTPKLLERAQQQ